MILVDKKPLQLDALNDKSNPLHEFAVEYDKTLKYLHERYKNGYIRFRRPGFPKYVKGADEKGREIPKVKEPDIPMRIPLRAYTTIGSLGKHEITCCLDAPTVLPNQLWDFGRTRAMTIKVDKLVNFNDQPDLAFFLYKVSPFTKKGHLQVVDPAKDDEEIGAVEMEIAETKYAVWTMLKDGDRLKTMARAYGVANVDTKQPNSIRKELEAILTKNNALHKSNPAVKGTRDFLEEMKVTDGILLRSFVQKNIDDKKLACGGNGVWKIGDKSIAQVPAQDLKNPQSKIDYLCNYLSVGNHTKELQEFMRDLINREYLGAITDNKEWTWLGKIAGVPTQFKKIEEVQEGVTKFFCPV